MVLGWFESLWKPWAALAHEEKVAHKDVASWGEKTQELNQGWCSERGCCLLSYNFYFGVCHLIKVCFNMTSIQNDGERYDKIESWRQRMSHQKHTLCVWKLPSRDKIFNASTTSVWLLTLTSMIKALFRNWNGQLFTGWNVLQSISWKVNGTIGSKKGNEDRLQSMEKLFYLHDSHSQFRFMFCFVFFVQKEATQKWMAIQLDVQN